jgi:plasmid segregation protein ParM
MSDDNDVCLVAIDDGYAQIKLYGRAPDGTIVRDVNRSSVRSGRNGIGSVTGDGFVGLYETEIGDFTVSDDIEAENTQFDGYHTHPMNRVLVTHGLVSAGDGVFQGKNINLMTGLPVADFFQKGFKDDEKIDLKTKNLLKPVTLLSGGNGPIIKNVTVGCQAIAAWYDYVFDDALGVRNDPEGEIAIIDIGGRTTDIATVINGKAVDHSRTGTANIGVLDVYRDVNRAISSKWKLRTDLPIKVIDKAVRTGQIKLWKKIEDVSDIVQAVIAEYQDKIAREVESKINSGATMNAVVFVGGGSALFSNIKSEFPNGETGDDPEFANARGLYKFALGKLQA